MKSAQQAVQQFILFILSRTSSSLKWALPPWIYSFSMVLTAKGAPPADIAWYFNLFMFKEYFGFVLISVKTSVIFSEVKIGSAKVVFSSIFLDSLILFQRAIAAPLLTKHSLFGCWSPKWGHVTAGVPVPMHSVVPPIPQWVKQAFTAVWDNASIWGSHGLTQNLSFSSGSLNGGFKPQITLQLMSLSPL